MTLNMTVLKKKELNKVNEEFLLEIFDFDGDEFFIEKKSDTFEGTILGEMLHRYGAIKNFKDVENVLNLIVNKINGNEDTEMSFCYEYGFKSVVVEDTNLVISSYRDCLDF